MKSSARRWRFFTCFQGDDRDKQATECILTLRRKGFRAKRWATLPEHYTSGHIHIVVLADLRDLLELGGVVDCQYGNCCIKYPSKCPADFKHGDRTQDYSCLKFPYEEEAIKFFEDKRNEIQDIPKL